MKTVILVLALLFTATMVMSEPNAYYLNSNGESKSFTVQFSGYLPVNSKVMVYDMKGRLITTSYLEQPPGKPMQAHFTIPGLSKGYLYIKVNGVGNLEGRMYVTQDE